MKEQFRLWYGVIFLGALPFIVIYYVMKLIVVGTYKFISWLIHLGDKSPGVQQVQDISPYAGQYDPLAEYEFQAAEHILDQIQALEYSADVIRKERDYYQKQLDMVYDPLERIKIEKKIAAAGKQLAAENARINKLKDKYLIV